MLLNATDNQQDALVQEICTNKHDQKKEEEKICPICFEVVQNDLNCIELSACKEYKHQYHKECIKQYLNYFPRCLFCQANIDPLDLERVGYVTKRCDFCFGFFRKDLSYCVCSCGHSVHATCRRGFGFCPIYCSEGEASTLDELFAMIYLGLVCAVFYGIYFLWYLPIKCN